MISIIAGWRSGIFNSTTALKMLGTLMSKTKDKSELKKLQAMIDEIIGMPENLPEEDDLDKQAWERYRRGE